MSDRISSDLRAIAMKVVSREKMSHVDLEQIEFVKRDAQKDKYADIRRLRFPASLYTDKMFIVSTYMDFDLLDDAGKEVVIWHELLHINPEDPEKLKKHDIEDFAVILKAKGIDWLQQNKKKLENSSKSDDE
jgi:predicted metallopeptidase